MAVCAYRSQPDEIFFDYKTSVYRNYEAILSGEYSSDKLQYLQDEQSIWIEKENALAESICLYEEYMENGEVQEAEEIFDENTYQSATKRRERYLEALEVVHELIVQSQKMEELLQEGKHPGYVDETGYQILFQEKGRERREETAMLLLISLVLSLAGIVSFENNQGAVKFIRSTKRGRIPVFRRKVVLTIVTSILLSVLFAICDIIYVRDTYGLGDFTLAIQSLPDFESISYSIQIDEMIGVIIFFRIVATVSTAFLILSISAYTRQPLFSEIICLVLFLLPALLYQAGVEYLSVLPFFAGMNRSVTGWVILCMLGIAGYK